MSLFFRSGGLKLTDSLPCIGIKGFKVVFKKKKFRTQFVGHHYFVLENFKKTGGNDFKVQTDFAMKDSRRMEFHAEIAEKSFVVESLLDGNKTDCKQTGLKDLKPDSCHGKVQLRELSADD